MLNIRLREKMKELAKGDAKIVTDYYDNHVACVNEFIQYGVEPPEKDFMFDVTSWSSWQNALTVHFPHFSSTSVPLWIQSTKNKKELSIAAGQLRTILKDFHGFLRTDSCIPKNSLKDFNNGKRFPGFTRSLKTLSIDKMKITNVMLESLYYSTMPDLGLMIQDGNNDSVYIPVEILGGKIVNSLNNSIAIKFVNEFIDVMKDNGILPYHPQYHELDIPDFSFKCILSTCDEGFKIFNCTMNIPKEYEEKKLSAM